VAPAMDANGMPFMSFNPCTSAAAYVTTPKTISFRTGANGYSPACLRVPKGTLVTFFAVAGSFNSHPLTAGERNGGAGTTPTPIKNPNNNPASTAFLFTEPGFYPYHCSVHSTMNGVIWVTP
jgi:plastocyanin